MSGIQPVIPPTGPFSSLQGAFQPKVRKNSPRLFTSRYWSLLKWEFIWSLALEELTMKQWRLFWLRLVWRGTLKLLKRTCCMSVTLKTWHIAPGLFRRTADLTLLKACSSVRCGSCVVLCLTASCPSGNGSWSNSTTRGCASPPAAQGPQGKDNKLTCYPSLR